MIKALLEKYGKYGDRVAQFQREAKLLRPATIVATTEEDTYED